MYALVLWLHAALRWVGLAVAIVAVVRALRGRAAHRPWTAADKALGVGLMAALDLQVVLGGVLWAFGPVTVLAFHELDLAWRSPLLYFWAFIHPPVMIAAIAAAHVGFARIRRASDSAQRHRAAALWFGVALALMLAGSPWPGLPYGRPLLAPLP